MRADAQARRLDAVLGATLVAAGFRRLSLRDSHAAEQYSGGLVSLCMSYSVVNVEDIEGAGPGGAVRFVRRELGCEAFGINWFELPPGAEGLQHHESDSGQEEVSVVVAGSGHWRVDGEDVPVRVGSFIRFDPESTRCPVAGPEGMTFVSVGSRRGSYDPRGPF
jgi:mannose-6-phosphate isomerase-like protein (cupin superfamily)